MTDKDASIADVQEVGRRLADSLQALLDAIPGMPRRPSALAKRLGLSRVTCSKLLGALKRPTPFELLEAIPGPESLRVATEAADELGVAVSVIAQAQEAIDEFSTLVRERFGTRAALTAALSGRSAKLRDRNEQAGRVEVFNGIRRILGVETNTWLTSMFFVPSPEDDLTVAVTLLQGALGLRRLRNDTNVYFSAGAPYQNPNAGSQFFLSPVSLEEFYTHEPARLESSMVGGQLRHRLGQERLGKHAVMDMLTVDHDPYGSRRYAAPDAPLRGISLFVEVPARLLVCDVIVHRDIFPGRDPQLVVFNAVTRGPANPNDVTRDLDRVNVAEDVLFVPEGDDRFEVSEIPNYAKMIERVAKQIKYDLADFRVYRLLMAYPVHSFQFVIAFRAPHAPAVPN